MTGILDELRQANYISTLDLSAAYWQIPLAEDSKEITAFTVPGRGFFQFERMPYGLTNAPATFQRALDKIIGPEMYPQVFVYLDDIIIVSSTFQDHLEWLGRVLDKIRDHGLSINREKSVFCRTEVKYLGFVVNSAGLQVDPDKTAAVVEFPAPKNLKQIRRFLGMASWYRRFIPEFATVAQPLTRLTKVKQPWVWETEQQEAFEALKKHLTSAPTLACPDFSLHFTLQTDASSVGLGAVLTQVHEEQERVIAYASRSLTDPETKYTVTEQECLAVVWAVEKFHCYLEGYPFTVITDHSSLRWLHNMKDPAGRLARWNLRLMEYDYKIIHRKDFFTKWIEVRPLRKATGATIRKALEETIIYRWGAPRELLTDNGTEFVNKDLKQLAASTNMKHRTTPPYHPQANPTERVNRSLKAMIRAYVETDHRDWDGHLDAFRFAYNTVQHISLKATPAIVNLGREPEPADSLRRKLEGEVEVEETPTEAWVERMKRHETLRMAFRHALTEANDRQAQAYNLRRRKEEFEVGELVLVRNHELSNAAKHRSASLNKPFNGPLVVTKKHSRNFYEVSDLAGRNPKGASIVDMKPYKEASEDPPTKENGDEILQKSSDRPSTVPDSPVRRSRSPPVLVRQVSESVAQESSPSPTRRVHPDIEITEISSEDEQSISQGPAPVVTEHDNDEEPVTYVSTRVDNCRESHSSETPSICTEIPIWRGTIKIADIHVRSDLEYLNVKQLKDLLRKNRVDFRGCVERSELLDRASRLWDAHKQSRQDCTTGDMNAAEDPYEENLCRICWDSPIECVILECGHMACCLECGKQMNECPICRQYVVRVVRFFKA
nr:PREDICTED: uncharacterized protein LOC105272851 [Fopius arisanus]